MAGPRHVVRLSGAGFPERIVGGKGASLDRLVGWGASVPRAGVVTTDAYRSFVAACELSEPLDELQARPLPTPDRFEAETRRIDDLFLAAPMPEQLRRDILNLAAHVAPGGALAVRSSATAEDMSSASFAGQYRSFLGVETPEEILEAVRLVWASLWLPAARSYRRFRGIDESELAMAVVIMRLVDADSAGVVFTVDPGGREGAVRLEVVEGLGEQLVSGAVTPAAHVVARRRPRRALEGADPILDDVIDAALEVETWFGSPQDVEWAYDGDRLYLVQARPITTTPAALGDDDGFDTEPAPTTTYTTAGIAEMVPGLLPPLLWTTVGPMLEEAFRRLFDHLGCLPDDLNGPYAVVGRFRGRAALNLDLVRRVASELPGGSSDDVERQYFGRVISEAAPSERDSATARGSRGMRSLVRSAKEIRAREHFAREAEIVIDAVDQVLAARVDIPSLPADELIAYRYRLLDLAGRALAAELAVAAAAAAAYRGIELFLEPRVHPGEAGLWAQRLTSGGMHTCGGHMAFSVCSLVSDGLANDALAAGLTTSTGHAAIRRTLGATREGRRLLDRLDELLRLGGSAAIFAGPGWIEQQDLVWQVLRQAIRAGSVVCPDCDMSAAECRCGTDDGTIGRGQEARARAFSELERRLMRTWSWRAGRVLTGQIVDIRKRMLRRMATDAFAFLDRRERSKTAVLRLGGEVRRVHVELGNQLAELGLIESPTDVDFLASFELDESFAGAGPSFEAIARRRRQHDQAAAERALPQVFAGRPQPAEAKQLVGDSFTGWGGSPGRYRGEAHVIRDPAEPFERGHVMVARTTDPSWTPLFLAAGAIIVEEGGPLSHAAIVARELGVPAVLNIPGIVERLEGTGHEVTVDGAAGTVTIRAAQQAAGETAA